MKRCLKKSHDQIDTLSPEKEWDNQNELPPGWEKHEGKSSLWIFFYVDQCLECHFLKLKCNK